VPAPVAHRPRFLPAFSVGATRRAPAKTAYWRGVLDLMSNWKIGQAVILKSGGPTMTVARQSPHGDELWVCTWWSGGKPHQRTFHAAMLRPASVAFLPAFTMV
jgi:uncharacterized protein YodC (DUF2158 family)